MGAGIGKRVLTHDTKNMTHKILFEELDLIKIKNVCFAKDSAERIKQVKKEKKIFTNPIYTNLTQNLDLKHIKTSPNSKKQTK